MSDGTVNEFTYAGYMTDEETGFYYLMARYYHPKHGVFLSMDPDPGDADDPITQNGYTYADNNPVMMVDPDGHWAMFIPIAIQAARIAAPHVVRYAAKQFAKKSLRQAVKKGFKSGSDGEQHLQRLIGGKSKAFNTRLGKRVVDRYSGRWAHESKVGYVRYTKFARKQILKDRMLIRNPNTPVKGAHWHFYKSARTGKIGADPRILRMLKRNKIGYTIHH